MNVQHHPSSTEAWAELGRDLDALREEILEKVGEADARHIRRVVKLARAHALTGRALLHFGVGPLSFAGGVYALSIAKILENMEIGHNVLHAQYDFMGDPELSSQSYEWDNVCDAGDWKHSHNFEHHTFTNVLGKDRDLGYGLLRVSGDTEWKPDDLANPVKALLLALLFEWGVGAHDLRVEEVRSGEMSLAELRERARPFLAKVRRQFLKDYVFFPLIAGPNAPRVFLGNAAANAARNVFAFSIIFCGHFTDGIEIFDERVLEGESRGHFYRRQILGSSNFEGSRWLHLLSGHLSHQIEHHLFPDLPSYRYPELAVRVREICEKHGVPYNTGSFTKQIGTVAKRILRYALP
jgi:NADPH-dependent stearoyl-CoA 9-desaturase